MYKTKTAWKVVSDPYAPEAQWAPACAEPVTDEDPWHFFQPYRERKDQSTERKVFESILLSLALAGLGGVFAGQCVHVNYYVQHLFGQAFFGENSFAPWGPFYYWYNQANAVCTYIPLFFAYSMGFWSSVHNFGKKFGALSLGLSALYVVAVFVCHLNFSFVQEQDSYTTLLLTVGMIGSALAFFLGKTISKNVAAIISPRLVFLAVLSTFVPMVMACPPIMTDFGLVAFSTALTATLFGFLIRWMHSGSLKTSILLSLTAASPLVLCGLLHVPIAGWFESCISQTSGFGNLFFRELFYYMFLPVAALALPVIGTVLAHWIRSSSRGGFSLRVLAED